jgi:hypothetical protein
VQNSGIKMLDDTNQDVRHTGVMGLALIMGEYEWGPGIDLYDKNEEKYLGYWREWAKKNSK